MGRVLCVDYGGSRVGLAVSDPLGHTAQPHDVLHREAKGSLVQAILDVAKQVEAEEVVVGLPLRMDGTEGVEAQSVRAFAKALEERWGGPVVLWDERLSSVEASRGMRAAGVSARQARGKVDKVAAAVILRSYLASKSPGRSGDEEPVLPEPVARSERRPRERRRKPSLRRTGPKDWRREELDDL